MPFHEWRTRGSFSVVSCTKKAIVIEAAAGEIGATLLADAEHLLDHAAEHNASVYKSLGGDWSSPAWTVVTAYYWSFFSVMALTRLCGRSAIFLDRSALSDFRTLSGGAEQPGGGALYLHTGPYTTGTNRTMTLRPSKAQLHEAVWHEAHRLVSDVLAHCNQGANVLEFSFWSQLKRAGDNFGSDWCSKLRNAVNYRPGCGYREVMRKAEIDLVRQITRGTPTSIQAAADNFDGAISSVPRGAGPSTNVRLFSRILGYYAILVAAIAETLHADVLDRQGGDNRWRAMRKRFISEKCAMADDAVWPFAHLRK